MILILLSGIILSSSSFSIVPNFIKSLFLLGIGIGFVIFSNILEKKLNLSFMSNVYFCVGLFLIVLGIYSCIYFKLFGIAFSFNGQFKYLLMSLISIISALAFFMSYRKMNYLILLRLSVYIFYISISYFIWNFTNELLLFSILFISILDILSVFNSNKSILTREFKLSSNVISIVYFPFILVLTIVSNSSYLLFVNVILYLLYFIISMYRDKNSISNIILTGVLPIFFYTLCYKLLSVNIATICSSLGIFIYYIITYIFKEKKYLFLISIIVSNILLLINYLVSYYVNISFLPIIISILLIGLFIPLLFIQNYENKYLVEIIIQPIKVLLLCVGITHFLNYNIELISYIIILCNILVLFSILYKNPVLKNVYFIFAFTILLFTFIPSNINLIFRINRVMMFILGFILIYTSDSKEKYYLGKLNNVFYFISLISLFYLFKFITFSIQLSLLNILILILCSYVFKRDRTKCFISLLLILLPYYTLLNIIDINSSLLHILRFTPYILYSYLFTYLYSDKLNKDIRDILEAIVCSAVIIIIIFEGSLLSTLFIFIISILAIVFDKLFKSKSLFAIGIGSLILNIVVNLYHYWSSIPIWMYLLICGLVLVGIITYTEIRKNR